jgi:hypothetical protein
VLHKGKCRPKDGPMGPIYIMLNQILRHEEIQILRKDDDDMLFHNMTLQYNLMTFSVEVNCFMFEKIIQLKQQFR